MSDWRKRLQPASFRGVPFKVDSDSSPVGRDVVVHEYPKKDKPYVEDSGRKTRVFRFPAFVIGPDCFDQRDKLLLALDTAGSGELVHPWYGRMKVTANGDCTVSHDRREGGMVRFDLAFVEAGELGFPTVKPNNAKQVQTSAQAVRDSASTRFAAALEQVNMAKVKVNNITSSISSMYATINNNLRPLTSLFSSASGMINSIMNAPQNMAAMVFGTLSDLERAFSSFGGSGSSIGGSSSAVQSFAAAPVPPGADAGKLHSALVGLLQDASIYNGLLDTAQVPVIAAPDAPVGIPDLDTQLSQEPDGATAPITSDVIDIRDGLNEAIHVVAMSASGDHYLVLTDARQAANLHLSNVARAGIRLISYSPRATTPALVLAYRLYADASRAGEIVSRNKLRHPGFVPAVPLEVASK
ncbi:MULTISPECIES: DNA circularization N-terminal domain-containing protein [unclassified Herbaspirillum]|uniref:DNA circularization protein n=1 Tax=unclassified Herbaspirillum TaxID=2624150 RepID=UPI000E2F9A2A|nr:MULTISPECIES: DNA circularization N-terminal domain-containing protein [unclassified Herbaspirillum]RFB73819.1 DNA circulation family protein [Herbaspirillum sp. 3R-3a1]TFI10370.1 DNA circulation family protein [Herbaspirillum sp. 3R11]TFI16274.1 DNA circulation family protein [Herbaspirillum sp. 3R-11]TFI28371.1 DNA circulation family protein [Herbaspirillum sp. 3C11]